LVASNQCSTATEARASGPATAGDAVPIATPAAATGAAARTARREIEVGVDMMLLAVGRV
jgi:hypothetical protein